MDSRIIKIWANLPDPKTVLGNLDAPFCIEGSYPDGTPKFGVVTFKKKMIHGKMQWEFPFDFRYK